MKEGNHQLAYERLLSGVKIAPNHVKMLYNLGKEYVNLKQYRKAYLAFTRCLTNSITEDEKQLFRTQLSAINTEWNSGNENALRIEKEKSEKNKEEPEPDPECCGEECKHMHH